MTTRKIVRKKGQKQRPSLEFHAIDWNAYDEVDLDNEDDSSKTSESESETESTTYSGSGSSGQENKLPKKYVIYLHGLLTDGTSVGVKITGFTPFFYFRVPESWNERNISRFVTTAQRKMYPDHLQEGMLDYRKIMRKQFYYFTLDKKGGRHRQFPFVRVKFKSKESMNSFMNVIKKNNEALEKKQARHRNVIKIPVMLPKGQKFDLYESNIDPLIRFLHIQNINPCGWIRLDANTYEVAEEPLCRTAWDVEAKWMDVKSETEKSDISPLIVASYDIEADSSHGDFPLAKKDYRKLSMDIVTVLTKMWKNDKTQNQTDDSGRYFIVDRDDTQSDSDGEPDGGGIQHSSVELDDSTSMTTETSVFSDFDLPSLIGDMIWTAFHPTQRGCLLTSMEINQIYTEGGVTPSRTEVDKAVGLLMPFLSNLESEWILVNSDTKEQFIFSITNILNRYFPKVQGDRVIQIGTVFFRYGDTGCFRRHITTLHGCDPIENVVVEAYNEGSDDDRERGVIIGWAEEIKRTNPQIMTGYNIFGFDYHFIWDRAVELGCQTEMSDILTKISHRKTFLEDKTLSSAGLGHNELKYFNMPGTIQMDLFKIIQRDHNLVSYKLDFVSGNFITGKISGTCYDESEEATTIFTNNTLGVIRDNFITFWYPVQNGVEKYQNGLKIKVIDYGVESEGEHSGKKFIIVDGNHTLVQGDHSVWQWGLAKDDVSPSDIFRLQKGDDSDRAIIAKYCVQDCELCINLCNKLDIISNNIGMSNVCSVPLSYIFLRGQGVKIFSLVAKQCRLEKFLIITRARKRDSYHDQMMSHEDQFEAWMEREVFRNPSARVKCLVEVPKYGIVKLVTPMEEIPVASDDIVRIIIETPEEKKIRVGLDELALERFHETKYFYVTDEEFQNPQVAAYHQSTKRHVHLAFRGRHISEHIQKITVESDTNSGDDCEDGAGEIDPEKQSLSQTQSGSQSLTQSFQSSFTSKEEEEFQALPYFDRIRKHFYNHTIRIGGYDHISGQVEAKEQVDFLQENRGWQTEDPFTKEGYEGAIVLPPQPGIYLHSPVSVLDYSSLYPSSMISENLSHDSFIQDPALLGAEGARRLKKLGIPFKDIEYDNYMYVKKGKSYEKRINPKKPTIICRFVQPDRDENGDIPVENRAVVPRILMKVLKARKDTRKKIPGEKDPFKQSVLEGLQLAYKVTANSLYGSLGAETSPVYFKDIAAATTATGRKLLYLAKDFVTKNFPGSEAVYGDTDSVFINYHPKGPDGKELQGREALVESIRLGVESEKGIQPLLEYPHKLEYEKTFMPFVLLSKKRYVGEKFEMDPDKSKQTSMGIVLKRRDNAPIVKYVYGGVIDIIMNEKNIAKSLQFLKDSLVRLLDGEFPLEELIISKSLRGFYKDPDKIAHKVLADRMGKRDPGNKPQSNDRIPYVYIKTPAVPKGTPVLQGDKIEHPDWIRSHDDIEPDYVFYITNQIMKPVSQIYSLIVETLEGYDRGEGFFTQLENRLRQEGKAEDFISGKVQDTKMATVEELIYRDPRITSRMLHHTRDPDLRKKLLKIKSKRGQSRITQWFGSN